MLGWIVRVSVFGPVIDTVQVVPDTLVHPDQLLNSELVSGLAVSTTVSPFANVALHGTPDTTAQVKPAASENAVPPPPPMALSVSGYLLGWNVAVTVFAMVIEAVQLVPDTLEQPDQYLKIESAPGAATRVMLPPFATGSVQSPLAPLSQAIPGPLTVPVPVPPATAVRRYVAGWNVAVTAFAPVMETVQLVPDALVQPDHDLKIASAAGVAVSVTLAPFASTALQPSGVAALHPIPDPSTVPFPATVTDSG